MEAYSNKAPPAGDNNNTPLGNNLQGQVGNAANLQVVVEIVSLGDNPPPVPEPNGDMILASATSGMSSIEATNQYLNMTAAQKNQLNACFIKKTIQEKPSRNFKKKLS